MLTIVIKLSFLKFTLKDYFSNRKRSSVYSSSMNKEAETNANLIPKYFRIGFFW